MAEQAERRKYRRFEIPGSKVKIKTSPGAFLLRPFLKQYPCLNIGMGGINFLSAREFIKGEELIIELHAQGEKQIQLRLRVIWTNPVAMSKDLITGCEFMPFGEDRDTNSPDSMNILRRLYARYIMN